MYNKIKRDMSDQRRRSSRHRRVEVEYPTDEDIFGYNWNHCFLTRAILDDTIICQKIRLYPAYQERLYSTLCNNVWQSNTRIQMFSFRTVSELITYIDNMDNTYMDGPYLSMNEGFVFEDITTDLDRIGYSMVTISTDELSRRLYKQNFNIVRHSPIWKKIIWFTAYDHDIVRLNTRIDPEIYLTETDADSIIAHQTFNTYSK